MRAFVVVLSIVTAGCVDYARLQDGPPHDAGASRDGGDAGVTDASAADAMDASTCTKIELDVAATQTEGAHAFALFQKFGGTPDTNQRPAQSKMRLFEDETELGPAHALHVDISERGMGRFSHYSASAGEESLRFSSSDNTSVRTNGRKYTYCLPP